MPKYNLLSIIIVNWNAGSQLSEVVNSINQYHHGLLSSLIIVDNASTDDSLAQVELLESIHFQLKIIRNITNRGFGAACNQGAQLANSEFILFLNPDTRLFENSLAVPLEYMQNPTNQSVGIAGIQLIDQSNRVTRSCARFPDLWMFIYQILGINRLPGFGDKSIHMTDWAHNEPRTVDHVIGAYYLIRRALFNAVGGFDERFFVYLEDLDLSLRVRQAGFASVYLTNAQAFHAGGGTSRQVKAHRLFYALRSRLLYGFKHFSAWQAWILVLFTTAVEPIVRTFFTLTSDGITSVRITWQAYGMLLHDFASILKTKSR